MAKVSPIRTNEKEYSVPVVLSYRAYVTVFAKTMADARAQVVSLKPKKLRKQSDKPVVKIGRVTVVAVKKSAKAAHA